MHRLQPHARHHAHATSPLIQQCRSPESPGNAQTLLAYGEAAPDTSQERIEVSLNYGTLTEKHTDFYLPGPVPIRFERALISQLQAPEAFGMSGSHNYDRFLTSHDAMRHISIVEIGDYDTELVRKPEWMSTLPLARWVDAARSGYALSLRWMAGGYFSLTRFNGEIESYMPCTDAELCYLMGYQDPAGQQLTFARDSQRTLTALNAPQNIWLRLSHDDPQHGTRVTSILDSQGHSVRYTYNAAGQLSAVAYPSGETIGYTWDSAQNLLTVTSTLVGEPPVTLITNRYDRGKLAAQTLADGSIYTYAFLTGTDRAAQAAQVTTPDGSCYRLVFGNSSAAMYSCQNGPETTQPTSAHTI